jgi:hypothetical protein
MVGGKVKEAEESHECRWMKWMREREREMIRNDASEFDKEEKMKIIIKRKRKEARGIRYA